MNRTLSCRRILLIAVATTAGMLISLPSASAAETMYAPLSVDAARQQVDAWLAARNADADLQAIVAEQWKFASETPVPEERFDAVIRSLYLADADIRALVDACRTADRPRLAAGFPVLDDGYAPPFVVHNLRAFYGEYLAVLTLYDESLAVFDKTDPALLVDPAGCLFYRAVCQHALLERDAGLETISTLLTRTEGVPVRYSTVAELMQADLEALKEKSLDEVARQMRDVERRLALGRAGETVQRVEDRIVNTLDEIIQKIEQQQGGGGGGGGSSQGQPGGNPASDSYVGGVKGPGEVEKKDIGHKDNWGNLPDKAQAAAKTMIDRQFPFHYRRAVEEYLQRIAKRPAGE